MQTHAFSTHAAALLAATTLAGMPALERRDANSDISELRRQLDGFMNGWDEFKKTNDARIAEVAKKGVADVLTEEKLGRINEGLDKLEKLNQGLTLAEKTKAAVDDLEERFDALQLKLQRPGGGGAEEKLAKKKRHDLWARAVINAVTTGEPNLPEEQRKVLGEVAAEMKSLNITNDVQAGYLAPTEYVREIIKGVTEISPVRSIVRVRTTASKAVELPKRTGQFAAQWVADQGTRTETTGLTYGLMEVPVHEMFALIDISQQMLEDSAFDLEAEIRMESEEQFSVAEGAAVVSGSGVGRPFGFMTDSNVSTTNSGAATAVTADGLLTLKHAIKTAYTRNANFVLNRTTLGSVRKLKDGNGQYLWMPGLAAGKPNSIDGDPYVELPDMPSEGAGLKPVAYGDFRRGYTLIDRIAMVMLRDPYTQATSGNIRYIFRRRIGGQVTLAEAIRTLTCA